MIAWVLMPSFKPKLETFVSRTSYGGELTQTGKVYPPVMLYETKEQVIEEGWRQVHSQQADINKRQARLTKRINELNKASVH